MNNTTRTIQEIFNAIIDAGHFTPLLGPGKSNDAMCAAAKYAYARNVITHDEFQIVKNACRRYIEDLTHDPEVSYEYLEHALEAKGIPHSFAARLTIYLNWSCRPGLDKY